jgi:alpha-tubulin suppressor-like RCC1 family protein
VLVIVSCSVGARVATAAAAVAISAGNLNSCLISAVGGVECWGLGLGNASVFNSSVPVAVPSLAGGVASVAAGQGFHSCVITTAGGARCWGQGDQGQLGNGSFVSRVEPVDVSGFASGIAAIAPGGQHTCALTTAGGVWCWGRNFEGELGNGTFTDAGSNVPVAVSGLSSGVEAIAAGTTHTCAITTGGELWCWGANEHGQLGDGTTTNRSTPVAVTGLASGVSLVSAGAWHTCAVTAGGTVQCWGSNQFGELGDGSVADHATPAPISTLMGGLAVESISSSGHHNCVLTTGGDAWCWGWNGSGQLGHVTASPYAYRPYPLPVSRGNGIAVISAGATHNCASTTEGHVECWGSNTVGELGDGSVRQSSVPITTAGPVHATAVAASSHSCALTTSGGVECWGYNSDGGLGDGTQVDRSVPRPVAGLESGVEVISAGVSAHRCAIDSGGGVLCWGRNEHGQLGDGTTTDRTEPVAVSGLSSGVVAVATGYQHTCAVTDLGIVQCWGANSVGQLGNGTTLDSSVPVPALLSGVTSVATGWVHTCALTTTGSVYCWGDNSDGQLGSDTSLGSAIPAPVTTLASGVMSISAGTYHNCALSSAGAVSCWGDFASPKVVSGLSSGVAAVSAGDSHSCAILVDGSVECWGYNEQGQLGDGTSGEPFSYGPVAVTGLAGAASAIAAGWKHTCAATEDGVVQCWGENSFGQLGDGSVRQSTLPRAVVGYWGAPACSDGIDNDGDGFTDFPGDPGCEYDRGLSELPEPDLVWVLPGFIALAGCLAQMRRRVR